MPRLYRPTGMRKYRPFGGPGGKLLSVSGGGGGGSAVGTEDFESYSAAELTAQSTWTQDRGSASMVVVTVGDNQCNMTVNAAGLCTGSWGDIGTSYSDGTIKGEVAISTGGPANCQPGFVGRYVDGDNLVYCALNNGFNNLHIGSLSGGVGTGTNTAVTWTRGTRYYVELIMAGTALTCNVYSDSGYTTLLHTVSHTSNHDAAGGMGISVNAENNGVGWFDDWSFTT